MPATLKRNFFIIFFESIFVFLIKITHSSLRLPIDQFIRGRYFPVDNFNDAIGVLRISAGIALLQGASGDFDSHDISLRGERTNCSYNGKMMEKKSSYLTILYLVGTCFNRACLNELSQIRLLSRNLTADGALLILECSELLYAVINAGKTSIHLFVSKRSKYFHNPARVQSRNFTSYSPFFVNQRDLLTRFNRAN